MLVVYPDTTPTKKTRISLFTSFLGMYFLERNGSILPRQRILFLISITAFFHGAKMHGRSDIHIISLLLSQFRENRQNKFVIQTSSQKEEN